MRTFDFVSSTFLSTNKIKRDLMKDIKPVKNRAKEFASNLD